MNPYRRGALMLLILSLPMIACDDSSARQTSSDSSVSPKLPVYTDCKKIIEGGSWSALFPDNPDGTKVTNLSIRQIIYNSDGSVYSTGDFSLPRSPMEQGGLMTVYGLQERRYMIAEGCLVVWP
jgi:hypothetical protein